MRKAKMGHHGQAFDQLKKLSAGKKILDPQEEILQNQCQFLKGGFASRLMELHLGLS